MPQLSGKKAIVTDGSRGIGEGIVHTFAEGDLPLSLTMASQRD